MYIDHLFYVYNSKPWIISERHPIPNLPSLDDSTQCTVHPTRANSLFLWETSITSQPHAPSPHRYHDNTYILFSSFTPTWYSRHCRISLFAFSVKPVADDVVSSTTSSFCFTLSSSEMTRTCITYLTQAIYDHQAVMRARAIKTARVMGTTSSMYRESTKISSSNTTSPWSLRIGTNIDINENT